MDKNKSNKKNISKQFEDMGVSTTATVNNKNNRTTEKIEKTYAKNGYVRPEKTFTDQLSKEQIEEKLEDYTKVEDIYKVPLGVHIRYFSNINGKLVFRMGGQLYKNNGLPDYIMLNSGTAQWSVQTKDTIFYRKMTLTEIKQEYQTIIDNLIEKNKKLKEENKKLLEKIDKLK